MSGYSGDFLALAIRGFGKRRILTASSAPRWRAAAAQRAGAARCDGRCPLRVASPMSRSGSHRKRHRGHPDDIGRDLRTTETVEKHVHLSGSRHRRTGGHVILIAAFESGRRKKRALRPLLWKTVVIRRQCGDRAMDATDLIRTLWRRSAALQWTISSESARSVNDGN
jgi:hypothetical protein